MAVYKATYCNPMLSSLDIRVATSGAEPIPCEWFTCKIDSSNKKITGYKVRILDSANNQIFPSPLSNSGKGYISPISELPKDSSDIYSNSGLNGTMVKIPFFQNYNYSSSLAENEMVLKSFNAIYYIPRYRVDYVLIQTITNTIRVIDSNHLELEGPTAEYDRGDNTNDVFAVGDILLSLNDLGAQCERGIFKITGIEGTNNLYHLVSLERVNNIGSDSLAGHEVVVTKGVIHDTVYLFRLVEPDEEEIEIVVVEDHSDIWVDIEGHPIDINISGSYKWELTLYQGDALEEDRTVTLDPGGAVVAVSTLDYSDISYNWYDTVLNSGKVLGSTNKRIQVASDLSDSAIVPLGSPNSPLVLQGTYIQLLDENKNPISSRAYVQSYDATFGHVYPINDGFTREDINAAHKVCFYKHSNNVEDVLAKERVVCATTENLNLYVEDGGQWKTNPNLGLPVIDGVQLEDGQSVLVKDQSRSRENGVYVAHTAGTGWNRSGSYTKWGDYIGAILFVINGDTNGATNWESTAGAGGSLFNGNTASGESLLTFIPEEPIILFSGAIKKTVALLREKMFHELPDVTTLEHTGNYYKVRVNITASTILNLFSDGIALAVGQRLLCYNSSHKIIEVIGISENALPQWYVDIEYNIVDSAEVGNYIQVLNGRTYGGHIVVLRESTVTINDEAKIAFILKNTTTRTYISPYSGLKKDMALKFINNKTITYADDQVVSSWLRITSVNTTTWCIEHSELTQPLASESAVDSSIPYSYEVRTYYRTSDENPFYTNEVPYLWIQVVTDPSVDKYKPLPTRYVTLEATYCQFQQNSWESYRWTLVDGSGKVVQDTDLKYDHDMTVTFYGLSNEEGYNEYKAILYVTDEKKNSISAERQFTIKKSEGVTPVSEFNANFDCSTHSFVLSCTGTSGEYSVYRREYAKYYKFSDPSDYKDVQGAWEPVALKIDYSQFPIRDFNIKGGHSYQYVIYPASSSLAKDTFANLATRGPYINTGIPKEAHWDEWSLIELKPVENVVDAPILRKTFIADLDNIWLFKYGLETGNQTQNIQKSDIQTLGRYSKIGYGRANSISGDVSCYLGSEIVPYSAEGYIERMRKSINIPLSTNEKALMLQKWRDFAFSPNPKLLRDIKGQSWIVQIMSSSNSPKNFYYNQPDTISFSWKQIDDTDGVVIIGSGEELPEIGCYDSVWKKVEAE